MEEGIWPDGVTPTAEFNAVIDFVRYGRGNLFVTGKAGTGKSTLLRAIKKTLEGRVVIGAPTGVAALNAGGSTMNSLFGINPNAPLVGADAQVFKFRGYFKDDDLTILLDEVSMIRADTIDALDRNLQRFRESSRPFGGIRVIAFGDCHQLSPVVKRDSPEKAMLAESYGGEFFFLAPAARSMRLMELTSVFRQRESALIDALNELREGRLSAVSATLLNSRLGRWSKDSPEQHVWLSPTRAGAEEINSHFLSQLPAQRFTYEADITGDFPKSETPNESNHPTNKRLTLCVGARVLFVKNDAKKRWVNGTCGTVTKASADGFSVVLDSGVEYEVERTFWQKTVPRKNEYGVIEPVEIGRFTQFPVRLGWGITVHKSQGMTLSKVCFCLSFLNYVASGLAYVAISRCKSLEGLALNERITADHVHLEKAATAYRSILQPLIVPAAAE